MQRSHQRHRWAQRGQVQGSTLALGVQALNFVAVLGNA